MIAVAAPALRNDPFPHTAAAELLPLALCDSTLAWLEHGASWRLQIASFYEQWEVHLDAANMPPEIAALCAPETVVRLATEMLDPLGTPLLTLTEITAHKLVSGQTIRIHNDFLPDQETHRILLQLNRGWRDEQGGLLMLFGSASPQNVRRIVRPRHGSVFGFGITPMSFHAVSTIREGQRYTVVYSFRATSLASGS